MNHDCSKCQKLAAVLEKMNLLEIQIEEKSVAFKALSSVHSEAVAMCRELLDGHQRVDNRDNCGLEGGA